MRASSLHALKRQTRWQCVLRSCTSARGGRSRARAIVVFACTPMLAQARASKPTGGAATDSSSPARTESFAAYDCQGGVQCPAWAHAHMGCIRANDACTHTSWSELPSANCTSPLALCRRRTIGARRTDKAASTDLAACTRGQLRRALVEVHAIARCARTGAHTTRLHQGHMHARSHSQPVCESTRRRADRATRTRC